MNNVLKEDFSNILQNKFSWKKLKNSSILITGASGYLANYLIKFLLYLNEKEDLNIKIVGTTRDIKRTKEKFKSHLKLYLHACSDDRNGNGESDSQVSPEIWFDALKNIRPFIELFSIICVTNPAFRRHVLYSVN